MEILYGLAEVRSSFFDSLFLVLTNLGSEMAAIAIPFILYWCVSKRKAYYVISNVLLGTALNQALKFFCRVPRPFVQDPEFRIVEAAREGAGGYSFPSGHTHTVTAIFGALTVVLEKAWARVLCIVAIVLVGFSRMYLGVHYPTDVLGGLGCGLVLLAVLYPVYRASGKKPGIWSVLFGVGAGVTLAAALVVEFSPLGKGADPGNWAAAVKNLNLTLGCLLALAVCEPLERKKIRFETKAVWWVQVLKVVLGFAAVMALRIGLKPVLSAVFGELGIGNAIRYFVIGVFALAVWPMTFRWFSGLGRQK